MSVLSSFGNRRSSPYGSLAIPMETAYITTESNRLLVNRNMQERMHKAAIQGGDDSAPNQVIREIYADAGDRLGREAQEASKDIEGFLSQISDVEGLDPELRFASVESTLIKVQRPREDDAVAAKSDEVKHRHQLNRFKAVRGIAREPNEPTIMMTIFIMSLFISLELATGFYLYRDVEADVPAAVMLSLLIVVATSTAASLTGFFALRHAVHGYHRIERVAGTIGTLVGLFIIIYLALLVSHDRDQLAAFDPDQSFIRRMDWGIIFHPSEWFHFQTLEGPAFLIILLVLGILSLWKSYSGFSDPIPGYTRHHENWRNAANGADDRVRDLRDALRAPIEREEQLLDQEIADNKNILRNAQQMAKAAVMREQRYRDSSAVVIAIINTAITKAQEAYLEIRPQKPAYFDQFLSANDIRPLSTPTAVVVEKEKAIADVVAQNATHAQSLKVRLNTFFGEADKRLQAYLDNLEELGSRRLHRERTIPNIDGEPS
ncbi:hypothetical protein ACQQ2Q_22300 [Agrobacterium sp. ES01]|uniref:hypothetical protein n=1 Tax=Agrobacterium sp. ES01 TaxID=3420714 RepID=UPI003D09FDAE